MEEQTEDKVRWINGKQYRGGVELPDESPWLRLNREGKKAYECFIVYRDMGSDRSTARVAKEVGRSPSLTARWCTKYRWVERTERWERHAEELQVKKDEDEIVKMKERQLWIAKMMQSRVMEKLAELSGRELENGSLPKWFETGMRAERLLMGIRDEDAEKAQEVRIVVGPSESKGKKEIGGPKEGEQEKGA